MPWQFSIKQGRIYENGIPMGDAYSGAPGYIDNPDDEALKGLGPICEGWWTMGAPVNSPETGPDSIPLTPDPDTETHGRSGFFIHGDSIHAPGTASHGCVICLLATRLNMIRSTDKRLQVVADGVPPFPALDSSITAE